MPNNALGLSDEDFLKEDHSAIFADPPAEDTTEVEDKEPDTSGAQEQTTVVEDTDPVSQPEGDTQTVLEKSSDSETEESSVTDKKDSPDTTGDTQDTTEFNYESAYKRVTQPFKANGTDMQVKDPEDMIRLMQMGANYQKKMAQLKPNLKMITMLEKNDLLDETKLNNLIDLSKKNPKAISKLIKESGIDPLDIDVEKDNDYKPTNYSVSDKEYQLDQVLADIKDTSTFTKTIDVLTKEWDTKSKTLISDSPEIIGVINTHMGNGVYDKVNSILQQNKALGKLVGVSDVEAYYQIAEHLHKSGVLKEQQSTGTTKEAEEDPTKLKADADRDKKRKAAAPAKQTAAKTLPDTEGFLGLSDEEFLKKYAIR